MMYPQEKSCFLIDPAKQATCTHVVTKLIAVISDLQITVINCSIANAY